MYAYLPILLFIVSCAGTHSLTQEGKAVKISHNKPSKNCKELEPVMGSCHRLFTIEQNREYAMNDIRNNASKLGSNYVMINSIEQFKENNIGSIVNGTAYHCP